MRRVGIAAALAATAALSCWSGGAAWAYRPFDGTDAAVAETGEGEIELGPVEYLREGSDAQISCVHDNRPTQRCGSTMTVPTLPPRSPALCAPAVSYSGKRPATDRIRSGDAVHAAMSDCARRRSACGTPASDIA